MSKLSFNVKAKPGESVFVVTKQDQTGKPIQFSGPHEVLSLVVNVGATTSTTIFRVKDQGLVEFEAGKLLTPAEMSKHLNSNSGKKRSRK
jgi:hypothetical protein